MSVSLSRTFGIVLVLLLAVGVVSQAADKKKKTKAADAKAKGGVFEDADKDAAADDDEMKADDKADPKADPKSAKPDPKSPADKEDAAEDDENGFGAGRKSSKAKKLDEAELSTDKDKARYVKLLRRQFEEEQGYYLVQAMEQGMEEGKDGAGSADPQAGGAALSGFKPYEKSELHVFAGRDEAVSFLVDYMTEYGKPWEKKPKKEKGSRGKKDKQVSADAATGEPPKPLRDFKIVDCFASAEEADMALKEKQAHLDQVTGGKNGDDGVKRGRTKKQLDEQ